MKVYLLASVTVVLLVVASVFMYLRYCPAANATNCCVRKACVNCTCPCTKANNVLRWVRDPNLGTLYYGWYSEDSSVFNCVGTSSLNKRMGNVQNTNVPVVMWQHVN